jgi:hypothetical protein
LAAGHQAAVEQVRRTLGAVGFAEAWAAGKELSGAAAIELGLAVLGEVHQVQALHHND